MTLLDAINYVLPKLGEHQVTSTDARSPTLRILLQMFDQYRRTILRKGWWFNEWTYEAPLNVDYEIDVGSDCLSLYAINRTDTAWKGTRLFNTETQSYKFDSPVKLRVIKDVAWDELPEPVQEWIKFAVLMDQLTTDAGLTPEYQVWAEGKVEAERQTLAEHLRNKRYNTKNSYRGRRVLAAIRGTM